MLINKKSQGLSVRTIIIAILVLIVLVVLITILVGQTGKGRQGLNDCENKGGTCEFKGIKECADNGGIPLDFLDCDDKEQTCCNLVGE